MKTTYLVLSVLTIVVASSTSTFSSPLQKTAVYVSPDGNDANSGISPETPLLNLQQALETAKSNKIFLILAESGEYAPGKGLSSDGDYGVRIEASGIRLVGGWDKAFVGQDGTSRLDGKNGLAHVLFITNSDHFTLQNFTISGGNADGKETNTMCGGGISAIDIRDSLFSNIRFENCLAHFLGGGLFMESGSNNRVYADFVSNAGYFGGGADFRYESGLVVEGDFTANTNAFDGGGLYLYQCSNGTISGRFTDNRTRWTGAGLALCRCNAISVGGCFSGNRSENGGGIYLDMSSSCNVNAVVTNNSVKMAGGGLSMESGNSNVIRGYFSDNRANIGGGIHVRWPGAHTVDSTVVSNVANFRGGGVMVEKGRGLSLLGEVSGNTAGLQGGGVCITASASNRLTVLLRYNSADNGGGLFMQSSSNDSVSCHVLSNRAGKGGSGITVQNGRDFILSGCFFDRNMGTNAQLRLTSSTGNTGFMLVSNRFVTDDGDPSAAIFEDGNTDLTGRTMVGNRFSGYRNGELYRNQNGKTVPGVDVRLLNQPGEPAHIASKAEGNVADRP
jgi:hypothetical protein